MRLPKEIRRWGKMASKNSICCCDPLTPEEINEIHRCQEEDKLYYKKLAQSDLSKRELKKEIKTYIRGHNKKMKRDYERWVVDLALHRVFEYQKQPD